MYRLGFYSMEFMHDYMKVYFVPTGIFSSFTGSLCSQEMNALCQYQVDFEVVNWKYEIIWVII